MPRIFQNASVGASGRRRLVPMMGIDYIAGNIEQKKSKHGPYGARVASMGGRTRKWSTINFLQVNPAGRHRSTAVKASEIQQRQDFKTACQSAVATVQSAAAASALQQTWREGTVIKGKDPNNYATVRGWVTAVRWVQIGNGEAITPTTDTWPPAN